MKAGFVGLGIMGRPISTNLVKGGVELLVTDLKQEAMDALVAVGAKASTYAAIGSSCDIVFMIVPNGSISKSILFDDGGLAASLKKGSVVVDMSSVTPSESRECHDRLKEMGIGFLDSPVSGGEPGAKAGTLAIMVGGEQENFEKAKPYYDIIGSSATLIGGPGSGSIAKLANQIIVNNTIAVVSEALVFARKAGADPEKVFQAIRGGLAGSQVLEDKAPMMITRNFTPGGPIRINHKDIKNVVKAAHTIDAPIPYSAQLFEIMQYMKIHGHMQEDHSAIVKYFEMLAGVEVGSPLDSAAEAEDGSGEARK